jgi:hypothetical protein
MTLREEEAIKMDNLEEIEFEILTEKISAILAIFSTWLKKNGLVVVPREATASMLAHASLVEVDDIELTPSEYQAAWQAMISAAPVTGLE